MRGRSEPSVICLCVRLNSQSAGDFSSHGGAYLAWIWEFDHFSVSFPISLSFWTFFDSGLASGLKCSTAPTSWDGSSNSIWHWTRWSVWECLLQVCSFCCKSKGRNIFILKKKQNPYRVFWLKGETYCFAESVSTVAFCLRWQLLNTARKGIFSCISVTDKVLAKSVTAVFEEEKKGALSQLSLLNACSGCFSLQLAVPPKWHPELQMTWMLILSLNGIGQQKNK